MKIDLKEGNRCKTTKWQKLVGALLSHLCGCLTTAALYAIANILYDLLVGGKTSETFESIIQAGFIYAIYSYIYTLPVCVLILVPLALCLKSNSYLWKTRNMIVGGFIAGFLILIIIHYLVMVFIDNGSIFFKDLKDFFLVCGMAGWHGLITCFFAKLMRKKFFGVELK